MWFEYCFYLYLCIWIINNHHYHVWQKWFWFSSCVKNPLHHIFTIWFVYSHSLVNVRIDPHTPHYQSKFLVLFPKKKHNPLLFVYILFHWMISWQKSKARNHVVPSCLLIICMTFFHFDQKSLFPIIIWSPFILFHIYQYYLYVMVQILIIWCVNYFIKYIFHNSHGHLHFIIDLFIKTYHGYINIIYYLLFIYICTCIWYIL